MLHELKDAVFEHPDYKGTAGPAESTWRNGRYCHPEVLRGVWLDSSEYLGMTRRRAVRSPLGVHHVHAAAAALRTAGFVDQVGHMARVFDADHVHDALAVDFFYFFLR
jgi:hypothetical protein